MLVEESMYWKGTWLLLAWRDAGVVFATWLIFKFAQRQLRFNLHAEFSFIRVYFESATLVFCFVDIEHIKAAGGYRIRDEFVLIFLLAHVSGANIKITSQFILFAT